MLNPTLKKDQYMENKEGYEVYKEKPDLELFLMASNLKPKRTFYEDNTVKAFMNFMDKLPKGEYKFAQALANFLNESGIKLAPVVMLNKLAEHREKISDRSVAIFNRPDKIANYIYLAKYRKTTEGDGFKNLTKDEKSLLKKALERMNYITLVKMQMKRRKIKTKDLIKMLRPKPKDERTAKKYKEIIENRAKAETLLTKRAQDDKEAVKHFEDNIEKMPVNMLIRNLRMYKRTGNPTETRNKILKRLKSIDIKEKVVNPFEFVTIAIEEPSLELEMVELIKKFTSKLDSKIIEGKTAVLYDVSGSMHGRGEEDGFKNLVILTHVFQPNDLYFFDDRIYPVNHEVLKLIKQGSIRQAKNKMKEPDNCTSLLNSLRAVCEDKRNNYDNVIVISDEVTWTDDKEINFYKDVADNKTIIAINPVKYKGTVFKHKFLALASLEAKIFLYMKILTDWNGFKKWVIDNFL